MATSKKRVAVAAFSQADELDAAVRELAGAGIQNEQLCLLAGEDTVLKLADDGANLQLAVMVKELSSVRTNGDAETLFVTPGRKIHDMLDKSGDGGGIAERLSPWLPFRQSISLQASLETGAALLWVCVSDDGLEQTVPEILLRHSAQPVQVHEVSH